MAFKHEREQNVEMPAFKKEHSKLIEQLTNIGFVEYPDSVKPRGLQFQFNKTASIKWKYLSAENEIEAVGLKLPGLTKNIETLQQDLDSLKRLLDLKDKGNNEH